LTPVKRGAPIYLNACKAERLYAGAEVADLWAMATSESEAPPFLLLFLDIISANKSRRTTAMVKSVRMY
jgi:hypothetical protein